MPLSGGIDALLGKMVNDSRDVVFVRLTIGCLLWSTLGLGLFAADRLATPMVFWGLSAGYLIGWAALFLDRFILMLHCTSHRRLYNKGFDSLNQVIPWIVGPFFGETPESYFVHHMGMHHPENNLEADLSSTMKYQRDSVFHWLHYFFSFLFFGIFQLSSYHLKRGNKKMLKRLIVGEGGFWLFVALMLFVSWRPTVVLFVIPVLMVRFLMMGGNWAQHAFVSAEEPGNPYKNSITCINTRYNRRCFNDGYHIHHHVYARCHWSEYPQEFDDNKQKYGEEDAIVFEGIDFFQVWLGLMMKRYRYLAKHFVQLPGAPERDESERIAFMKTRLAKISV